MRAESKKSSKYLIVVLTFLALYSCLFLSGCKKASCDHSYCQEKGPFNCHEKSCSNKIDCASELYCEDCREIYLPAEKDTSQGTFRWDKLPKLLIPLGALLAFFVLFVIWVNRPKKLTQSEIEKLELMQLQNTESERIKSFYINACKKLMGTGDTECTTTTIIEGISYRFNISNNTLFLFEPFSDYIAKHAILKKSASDLRTLNCKELNYIAIPVDDLVSFEKDGDIQYTTEVSGGGSNLEGAILGGLIAGDAGAIIASRQAIQSTTVTHDNRNTIIRYKRKNTLVALVASGSELYSYLLKEIPHKELTSVQLLQRM